MKAIIKMFKNIIDFIDRKIVTPITKLVVNFSSKYHNSSKKIEGILSRPNTLLFLSLFLAIFIFIVIDQKIINFTDNTAMVLKDRKIKVIYNEEKYVVEGLPESVDITLIGSKTDLYIAKQSSSNYVTVDLSGLKPGTHKVRVEYNQNNNSIEYSVNPSTITVVINEKVSETRNLSVDLLNDNSIDPKLTVEKTEYDIDKIVIKGSQEQLKQVVSVKALVDLNNIPEQSAGTYTLNDIPLKAYDQNGEVVNVEIVPKTISMNVTLSSPSKELPIKIIPKGEVAASYAIGAISSNETKVTVYGNTKALNDIKYVVAYVDVSGLKDNKTYKVDLEKPVGVKSMSVSSVNVSVSLGEVSTRKIENISIEPINLSSEYSVQGTSENATKVTVTLKGVKSVIDAMTAEDIKAYIDLKDVTEGEQEVEVKVEGTDNKIQYTSMTKKVKVKIKRK